MVADVAGSIPAFDRNPMGGPMNITLSSWGSVQNIVVKILCIVDTNYTIICVYIYIYICVCMYILYTYTARDLFQHQQIHVPVLKQHAITAPLIMMMSYIYPFF